jgi:Uma2 family endonuclease
MTAERLLQLPPLESGDSASADWSVRLSRAEFERRYAAMPDLKKAELIEGVVYMGSPVHAIHSQPHANIITWLGIYSAVTPGISCHDNPTVRLDSDNELQPDALLRLEKGGNSSISDDGCIKVAPELVVEIAASSASHDLHDKLPTYRRNDLQEYIVWRTYDRQIDWFYLEAGEYRTTPEHQPFVTALQAAVL